MFENDDSFHSLVRRLSPQEDNTWLGHIPSTWRQGRTAYGGLTTGLAYASAKNRYPNLPPLRTAQITFVGPVPENPTFHPILLRQGRNVTTVEVQVTAEDAVVATIIFMFGTERKSHMHETYPASVRPAPEACTSYTPPGGEKFVPKFFLKFDTKLIEGSRPLSGAKEGYIRVWARHKDRASRTGNAGFLALGDLLPPAALPMFTTYGPVSSMNWQMNILEPEIGTTDGWWDVETRLTAATHGYSSQIMRFWNYDGVLVAEGIQSVAIFV